MLFYLPDVSKIFQYVVNVNTNNERAHIFGGLRLGFELRVSQLQSRCSTA
jgi:hypothetical protein